MNLQKLPITAMDVMRDADTGALYVCFDGTVTQTDLSQLVAALAGGLPAYANNAAGADAYAAVVTSPARVCSHITVQLDTGGDAIISLDGGTTNHFYVKGGQGFAADGLAIPAGTVIKAKNAASGTGFVNCRISVW